MLPGQATSRFYVSGYAASSSKNSAHSIGTSVAVDCIPINKHIEAGVIHRLQKAASHIGRKITGVRKSKRRQRLNRTVTGREKRGVGGDRSFGQDRSIRRH